MMKLVYDEKQDEAAIEPTVTKTVQVTPEAKRAVRSVMAWSDLTEKHIITKLLEWLEHADQDTIGAIIGALPQSRRKLFCRAILESLAAEDEQIESSTESDQDPRQAAIDEWRRKNKKS